MFATIVLGTSLSETLCCLRGMREAGAQKIVLIHAMNIREVEVDVRLGLPFYEINPRHPSL